MFRHGATNLQADTDDRYDALPIGKRSRGHAVWLSLAVFVLLAGGVVGASMGIPPARLAGVCSCSPTHGAVGQRMLQRH